MMDEKQKKEARERADGIYNMEMMEAKRAYNRRRTKLFEEYNCALKKIENPKPKKED